MEEEGNAYTCLGTHTKEFENGRCRWKGRRLCSRYGFVLTELKKRWIRTKWTLITECLNTVPCIDPCLLGRKEGAEGAYYRGDHFDLLEKRIFLFSIFLFFLFFYLCSFLSESRWTQPRRGCVDRGKSSYLLLGKEGGGERYTIDRAALRVVVYVDSSMGSVPL